MSLTLRPCFSVSFCLFRSHWCDQYMIGKKNPRTSTVISYVSDVSQGVVKTCTLSVNSKGLQTAVILYDLDSKDSY